MANLKLFMVLVGCKPPGRHVEQHDFYFGIATSLAGLVPQIKEFWPEAADKIHLDGWREVNVVENHQVNILLKDDVGGDVKEQKSKLFFINLGGYQENKFEEQHYVLLSVKDDKATAIKQAKETLFYQHNYFDDATSHIDDKYGIDVDDLYQIEDILSPAQKEKYHIQLVPATDLKEDELNLGYFKLSSIV
jgi:hypothetical protein